MQTSFYRLTGVLLGASLALAACAGAPVTTADQPATNSEDAAPAAPEPTPAERLAHKVFVAHGGERLDEVAELMFTFVLQDADGERVVEVRHAWDMVHERDRITWVNDDGREVDVTVELAADNGEGDNGPPVHEVYGRIDGDDLTEAERAEYGAIAYRRWINDTYWLLMPLKMLDPGVNLELDGHCEIDGQQPHERIKMTFDNVGLTPGDTYWVCINPENYTISAWHMLLEGQPGEPTEIGWGDYQQVGPLYLPLERIWPYADRRLVFENVSVTLR